MRKLTTTLGLLVTALLLLAAVFHKQALCLSARLLVKGGIFSYETGNWEGSTISFHNAELVMQSGAKAQFEKIDIIYTLSTSTPFVQSKILCHSPTIDLREAVKGDDTSFDLYSFLSSRLFKREFDVERGVLYVCDEKIPVEAHSHGGECLLSLGNKEVFAKVLREGKSVRSSLVLRDLSLPWACKVVAKELTDVSGSLSGTASFTLSREGKFRDVAYDLTAQGVSGRHGELLAHAELVEARRTLTAFQDHGLFDTWFAYLISSGKAKQVSATYEGTRIEGDVTFTCDDGGLVKAKVEGSGVYKERTFPLRIESEGFCLEGNAVQALCSASCGELLQAKFDVSGRLGGQFTIASDFAHLQLDLLPRGALVPTSGVGSGCLHVALAHGKVLSLDIDEMKASGMAIEWNGNQALVGQSRISASLLSGEYDKASVTLDIRESSLAFAGEEITGIEGHLDMQEGKVVSSQFHGFRGDQGATLRLSGPCNALRTTLLFTHGNWECAINAKVQKEFLGWKVCGDLDVDLGEGVASSLDFGAHIDKKFLGSKRALHSGWFRGKQVHSDLVNLPVARAGYEWCTSGHFDINGSFDQEGIDILFDSEDGGFESYFVNAYLQSTEKRRLVYSRQTESWRGEIPIASASICINQVGLTFEEASGLVEISGNCVNMRGAKASSHGVECEGDIFLSFLSRDEADMEITTKKVTGSARGALDVMRHFASLDLDVAGNILVEEGGLYLKTRVGSDLPSTWKVSAQLTDGNANLGDVLPLEEVRAKIDWDSEAELFSLSEIVGSIPLPSTSYRLNVPYLRIDGESSCSFDVRVEAQTHDIFTIAGVAKRGEGGYDVALEGERASLFGSKVHVPTCKLSENFDVRELILETSLSCHDAISECLLLYDMGLLVMRESTVDDMRSIDMQGTIDLKLDLAGGGERVRFCAGSDSIAYGAETAKSFRVDVEKDGVMISVPKCQFGQLQLSSAIEVCSQGYLIEVVEGRYKDSHFVCKEGVYSLPNDKLTFSVESMHLCLEQLRFALPSSLDTSYVTGEVEMCGRAALSFEDGAGRYTAGAELELTSGTIGKGEVSVESTAPLHVYRDKSGVLGVEGGSIAFSKDEKWASLDIGCMSQGKEFSCHDMHLLLPPEMLVYLAKSRTLPYLDVVESLPFLWENQCDARFSFERGRFVATAVNGFYWFGERSWKLEDISLAIEGEKISPEATLFFDDNSFLVQGVVGKEAGELTIQEVGVQVAPLVVSASRDNGWQLEAIEGEVCGVECLFDNNVLSGSHFETVLTGQMKVDTERLSQFLPNFVAEAIAEIGIGKGYEFRGDIVIPKADMRGSYFKGFLKGKHFELFGSRLQTLMSEITVSSSQVILSDFTLSDDAGILYIDQALCAKGGDSSWSVTIPQLTLSDFRPSLLQKIGKYRGRMKPMIVRELSFSNVEGYLGDRGSFKGVGHLVFENSFKKEGSFFDIPFEIIARLGLDMTLLMPVQGRLEYEVGEGRAYFTSLSDSYSEGKRSRFYLSPSRPSFVDFDGDLNINIKMKQYVLLKVTEPFTLSVKGSVDKPKYSLN